MLAGAEAFASDDLARVTIDPRSRRQAVAGVQGREGGERGGGREGGGQHHFEAGSVSAWQAGHWQPHSHRLHPGLRSRYLLPKNPTDSAFTDLWFYSNIQTLPHQRRANESKPLEAEANHIVNISFTSQSYPENSLLCGDNRL